MRVIGDNMVPCFDIGSVGLREDLCGKGWFRRYLRRLGTHPLVPGHIYLQSVNAPRLLAHATKYWHPMPFEPISFYLLKQEAAEYQLG